jgi:protein required for attachment to host cells
MKMIEVTTSIDVIAFDGRVLEFFRPKGDTYRYHVNLIRKIELEATRRGQRIVMEYTDNRMPVQFGFEDEVASELEKLIAAVQSAM